MECEFKIGDLVVAEQQIGYDIYKTIRIIQNITYEYNYEYNEFRLWSNWSGYPLTFYPDRYCKKLKLSEFWDVT